jgi:hypothetical protein
MINTYITESSGSQEQAKMKFSLAFATMACVMDPTFSFSYLESISKANPVVKPATGASYLDALNSAGAAPTRGVGAGLGSYLDALPKSSAPSGSGMSSYSSSIGSSAAAPAITPVTPAEPAHPVAYSTTPSTTDGSVAPTTAGYLGALGSASVVSTGGSGMKGYLDVIPTTASAARGGAGIPTYKDALASRNVVQGGAGIKSHADTLSNSGTSTGKIYGQSAGNAYYNNIQAPSAPGSASSSGSSFSMSAEGLGLLVENMANNGGRISFSGTIDTISRN